MDPSSCSTAIWAHLNGCVLHSGRRALVDGGCWWVMEGDGGWCWVIMMVGDGGWCWVTVCWCVRSNSVNCNVCLMYTREHTTRYVALSTIYQAEQVHTTAPDMLQFLAPFLWCKLPKAGAVCQAIPYKPIFPVYLGVLFCFLVQKAVPTARAMWTMQQRRRRCSYSWV